jgi:hypothetical protein
MRAHPPHLGSRVCARHRAGPVGDPGPGHQRGHRLPHAVPDAAGGTRADALAGEPKRPASRYYALTDEGSLAVAAFARAWPTFRHAADTIVRTPPRAEPADSVVPSPATTIPTTAQESR